MKVLFVKSESHTARTGGGVTHTRGILSLFEMATGTTIDQLALPLPLKGWSQSARRLRAFAFSIGSRLPSKAHYLIGAGSRESLRAALARIAPDVVIFNTSDLLPLAQEVDRHTPCILASQNVETRIIERQAARLRVPRLLRTLLDKDVEKTRRMEVDGAGQMALVLAISSDDACWYKNNSAVPTVAVIPSTFNYKRYSGPRPPVVRPLRIGYLAKMGWWPNRQGAEAFLTSVLPALPSNAVESHFFGPGSETYAGRHPTLRAHGFVESLDTVWSSINFSICPILDGSGINVKLVESLYNRVPVLATPHAVRGLPNIDDPALAVVPLADWPDFIRSERAEELARASVQAKTAELFSAQHACRYLQSLLRQLVTNSMRDSG